jgi:hypothetical protein
VPIDLKSEILILEPPGPVQACTEIALPLPLHVTLQVSTYFLKYRSNIAMHLTFNSGKYRQLYGVMYVKSFVIRKGEN